MKLVIITLSLLLAGCSNMQLISVSTAALAADWQTTRAASQNWKACRCSESSHHLGSNPSPRDVDKWAVKNLLIYSAVNYTLWNFNKGALAGFNIGLIYKHGYTGALNNWKNDIHFDFTKRF